MLGSSASSTLADTTARMDGWAGVWVVLYNEVRIHVEGLVAGKEPSLPLSLPYLCYAMLGLFWFHGVWCGLVRYRTAPRCMHA